MDPRARCGAFDKNWNPCLIPYANHNGHYNHEFHKRLKHKVHIQNRREHGTYCGRLDVWEISQRADTESVRSLATDNRVCTLCLKNWIYMRQRIALLTGSYA